MIKNPQDSPGMTRYERSEKKKDLIPYTGIQSTNSLVQRNVILLATAAITAENLFMNGLFQNVYVLYRMFEAMYYLPILIVNKRPESLDIIPEYMRNVRIISVEEIAKSPIPVKMYIEIGMSIDHNMRRFLKMCGAKICKLYLGNILNIDIETPIFYPQMYFSHHVIGDLDEIWVSPHYYQHSEYARAINQVNLSKTEKMVAPYVWDPQILMDDGKRNFKWHPAKTPEEDVFLILEPNISFQKCSLLPLLIAEAWFRKNPDWKGEVVVINGERLMLVPFFKETVWNTLELVKAGRVKMTGRMDILTILTKYPSAIPICHQVNNEYNYMVLEYFWTGYPVLHNAVDWSDYGYYYKNSSIKDGVKMIETARKSHVDNFEIYKAHARTLAWRHSPYNPEVHRAWAELIQIDAVEKKENA
jgi:hypothetical protein